MNLFFDCPSSCVFPGYASWEGICPMFNLVLFLIYGCLTIIFLLWSYKKIKSKFANCEVNDE